MTEYIYEHKPSGADHMGKPVELPTLVQREEIVRCGDCVFREVHDGNEYPIGERGSVYCLAWSDGMQGRWTKPDGFCHKGNKEGGE